jgi:hypothetical protein
MEKSSRPFPYFGEGVAMARKFMSVFVAFREAVPAKVRKELRKGAPRVFNEFDWMSPRLLQAGHGGILQWEVAAKYPKPGPRAGEGEATDAQWSAFNREIDRWLLALHRKRPLAFVVKPVDEEYSTVLGKWHLESSLDAGPALWPGLRSALGKDEDGVFDHVIGLWRADLARQAVAEQARRLKALPKEAVAVLETAGGVPEPVEPRQATTDAPVEERLRIWQELPRSKGGLEERFEKACAGSRTNLNALAYDLGLAGRWADCAGICALALEDGVRFPGHYRDLRMLALVRAGDLAAADREIPGALVAAENYRSTSLFLAWIELLEKRGLEEDAAAAFHLARRLVMGFDEDAKDLGLGDLKRFGRSSKSVRERGIALWGAWILRAGPVGGIGDDLIVRAMVNAKEVGHEALQRELAEQSARLDKITMEALLSRGELKREGAFFEAFRREDLGDVQLERVIRAAGTVKDRGMAIHALADWAFRHIASRPALAVLAYEELMKLPPPEKGTHRTNWLRALNNAIIVSWQQKNLDLSRRLSDFAQPCAPENPYIYHSAACTYLALGDRARALEQTRLAIQHHYEKLDAMLSDPDLGALLKDAEYLALFPKK